MWHFRKMARAEINQDPTQEDFFNTEHLSDFSDALVREAIQNSLDAGVPNSGECVSVRIALPSAADMPSVEEAQPFFRNLFQHVTASGVVNDQPKATEPVDFLVFEDFGTRGLVGDPTISDDPGNEEDADFYYFWRNVGRAGKSGEQRGRWGLGKTMFPAASRLHAFFGLTVRNTDGRALLMGQSVLSIHRLDGYKRYPYGWFGESEGTDEFVLPVEDPHRLEKFSELFQLARRRESGLSVVVPYPRHEIEHGNLVRSVISHYFFPILADELVVEVVDAQRRTEISAATIAEQCKEFQMAHQEAFQGTLALARRFLGFSHDDMINAETQTPNRAPGWSEDLFRSTELDGLAEKLDSGQPVALRVPVHVLPKSSEGTESYFDMVLERDPELDGPVDVFIRSGITISGVRSLREAGVRALVVIREPALAAMLGDAENPAHTEWQHRSRNFVGKYKVGPSTLEFVRDAPRNFIRLINRRSEHIDDTALRHVFPNMPGGRIPEKKDPSPGTTPDPTRSPKPQPNVPRRPQLLRVSRTERGFRLLLTEHGQSAIPCSIRIRAAYDVRRGNPFKHWVSADFDLDAPEHQMTVEGGTLIEAAGNQAEVRAESSEFRLSASNFDPQRDLVVEATLVNDTNA